MDGRRYLVWLNWLIFIIIWRQFLVYLLWFSLNCFVRRELSYLLAPILWIPFQSAPLTFKVSLHSDSINAGASSSTPKYHRLFSKTKLALNWKVTEWVPKLASNWVLMLTVGGLPVAFCTTRKSLVTISMTCPVWKTKSPFLFTASEERQPGIFAWDLNSRVGDPCKVCEAQDGEKRSWDWPLARGTQQCRRSMDSMTAWRSPQREPLIHYWDESLSLFFGSLICLSMMMSTVIRLEIFQNASVVYKRGSVLVIYICVFVYLWLLCSKVQPVFDLHGPLVEDEHRTCRDDKQDRDKLQTKFENMKYKDSLQNTKYNLQNTKYILHNAKFKYKNASSLWRKEEGREIVNKSKWLFCKMWDVQKIKIKPNLIFGTLASLSGPRHVESASTWSPWKINNKWGGEYRDWVPGVQDHDMGGIFGQEGSIVLFEGTRKVEVRF